MTLMQPVGSPATLEQPDGPTLGWIYCAGNLAPILAPLTDDGRPTCGGCGDELRAVVAHGGPPDDRPPAMPRRYRTRDLKRRARVKAGR